MTKSIEFDKIAISVASRKIVKLLLVENPDIKKIFSDAPNFEAAKESFKQYVINKLNENPIAYEYAKGNINEDDISKLRWSDYAAIRILDYINNEGNAYEDLNLRGRKIVSQPIKNLYLAFKNGTGGATEDFFQDMLELFRQLKGKNKQEIPDKDTIVCWMNRHPSGLDEDIVDYRKTNKERILKIFIKKIDDGEITDSKYFFEPDMNFEEKLALANEWWKDYKFHLRFAIRSPELLNEMLDNSLNIKTLEVLHDANEKGIPTFVNPYYLSLINVKAPERAIGADLAIRAYVIYSRELVDEFGHIVAWEKEDIVEPGKPNAAGWILPTTHNIHRRYPEVAILIPDTMGRACAGLCASCQRMYDFQSGHLNFKLDKLLPDEKWNVKLKKLMNYFENDSQLRDILITGGDGLMSSEKSLKKIFDAVYEMALRKKQANENRPEGEKYAEMIRVRIGTRLPVYLPQRVTDDLIDVLKEFKQKASKIGIKQFIIQSHFETAMEITPEAKEAIDRIIDAGWMVTNQHVFTAQASRRGHNAKLRQVLNQVGVLPYYTFTVKGFTENKTSFANNARALQEQIEEKHIGLVPENAMSRVNDFQDNPEKMREYINQLREDKNLPFLATDRNVLNMPGVGKSLTFRVIGITRDGRRILEFDHDAYRNHSPIIDQMGKVIIIESKSIGEYLRQMVALGEKLEEYKDVYGYSLGETIRRVPIYEYPDYEFDTTEAYTNLEVN